MAYGKKKSNADGKFLRLTGLWPSKNREGLWTGRFRAEDMEKLLEKAQEALEGDAPLVFSLWENNEKEGKRDPDFTLQTFVGDAEEKPKSSGSKWGKKKAVKEDEPEEEEEEEEEEEDAEEESEDEEEKPKKTSKPTSKKRARW